ncbi:MAG: hypothetical protein FWF59_13260 [Turicibacter sp.]|nr:hypothetical protein [Turicibacter sp.]
MFKIKRILLMLGIGMLALVVYGGKVGNIQAQGTAAPDISRAIHVVMDDSWSMVMGGGVLMPSTDGNALTRWAQARYALMTLAGMLGEHDELNIYYLNEWGQNGNQERIHISGADPSQQRVETVRNHIPHSGGTPVYALRAAATDLREEEADELYLLIISDGQFDAGDIAQSEVDAINEAAPENQRTIFLGIGDDAPDIEGGFWVPDGGNEILDQIVTLGNHIFGRLELPSGHSQNNSFDTGSVAIDRLIVFAQGEGVRINSLENNGITMRPGVTTNLPTPRPEEAARHLANSPGVNDIRTDNQLAGAIAEFTGINAGQVILDIENASEVSFYFEPAFEIGLQLTHLATGEIFNSMSPTPLIAGEYQVEFGPMDSEGNFIRSPLLGNDREEPELLESTFWTAGWSKEMVENGSRVNIPSGLLQVQIRQAYLDRFEKTVSLPTDSEGFQIFEGALTIQPLGNPAFDVRDLAQGQSFQVAITNQDGTALTRENWDNLTALTVSSPKDIQLDIEKTAEVGIAEITASAFHGNIFRTATDDIPYEVTALLTNQEGEARFGTMAETFHIQDTLTFWEHFWHWLQNNWLLALLGILVLIWLIAKLRQKRLPKIKPSQSSFSTNLYGSDKIQIKSTYTPHKWKNMLNAFAPQTAAYRPWPGGNTFQLVATGTNRLWVKNGKTFCRDNTRWEVNGQMCQLNDKDKKFYVSKNDQIKYTDTVKERIYINTL